MGILYYSCGYLYAKFINHSNIARKCTFFAKEHRIMSIFLFSYLV